jgi:quercetin dioxygenase-like cupin family protein
MLVEATDNAISVSRDKVLALQEFMAQMPQAPGFVTNHFFAGGMYCRKMYIPKDSLIVSKVHKTEHFFIGCVGELHVAGQGDNYVIRPGDIVPSPIGTKRVVYALTDVVVLTVHKTDLLEADQDLEKELMETDPLSKYDVNNQPKLGVLVSMPTETLEN